MKFALESCNTSIIYVTYVIIKLFPWLSRKWHENETVFKLVILVIDFISLIPLLNDQLSVQFNFLLSEPNTISFFLLGLIDWRSLLIHASPFGVMFSTSSTSQQLLTIVKIKQLIKDQFIRYQSSFLYPELGNLSYLLYIFFRYVIQVWEPVESPLLIQLLRLGYRVISVPKNIWYLDHGFWGRTKFSNWRRMYAHTLPSDAGVLGGEVAMWTEYVDSFVLGKFFS